MTLKSKKLKIWLLLTCLIAINTHQAIAKKVAPQRMTETNIQPFLPLLDDLAQRFPKKYASDKPLIIISASEQRLYLIRNNQVQASHLISTGEAGMGNFSGSNKTPLGVHQVAEKFGKDAKFGTIFKSRMNTRKVAQILTKSGVRSKADNVTSRILWLSGLEKGINKGGKVDSHARYIYIHGTDEEGRLGKPASHGCIRMKNQAVINLFEQVPVGTLVDIID